MTRPIQRFGDANSGGGIILSIPQNKVYSDGELVAVTGSRGSGHGPAIHAPFAWETVASQDKVIAVGIPVNGTNDSDDCGHVRVGGSNKVFII